MARKKLTEEEKLAKVKAKDDKRIANNLLTDIKTYERRINFINEPTVFYRVGDKVNCGSHSYTTIIEIYEGGKFYKIMHSGYYKVSNSQKEEYQEILRIVLWTDIDPNRTPEENEKIPVFTEKTSSLLNFSNTCLSDIFSKAYHFGLEMNPDYQRGNVWNLEDKQKLIHSIFNNIDIGKFVYVHRGYEVDKSYEVLDGKQRVTTLVEFFENRFQYKGFYFKDLSWRDKRQFEDYNISTATLNQPTNAEKYHYFLKLNVSGHVVDPAHISYVENLLKEEK